MAAVQPYGFKTPHGSSATRTRMPAAPGGGGGSSPPSLHGGRPTCRGRQPPSRSPRVPTPGRENLPRRSAAGPERVKGASVTPLAEGGRRGEGRWRRESPGGRRAARGNKTSLSESLRDPTHMTGPGAPRAAPEPGRGSRSPRGENWAPAPHEAHRSLGERTPPAVPGPAFRRSQLRVPQRPNPRSRAPPPRPSRGGPPAPRGVGSI